MLTVSEKLEIVQSKELYTEYVGVVNQHWKIHINKKHNGIVDVAFTQSVETVKTDSNFNLRTYT